MIYLLDELEVFYIHKYNTFYNGYNNTLGGQGVKGRKHSIKDRKKISIGTQLAYLNNKINNKARIENIRKSLIGKPKSDKHKKKLSEKAKQRVGNLNPFYNKTHSTKTKELISIKNSKPVDMFSLDNKHLCTFKNAKIAASYLINLLNLSIKQESCYRYINWHCMSEKPYKGYIWKYHIKESVTTIENDIK